MRLPAAEPLGLIYLEHIPAPPLDLFVDRIWYCEGYQPPHALERVMPSGSGSLVIALANDWVSTVDPVPGGGIRKGSPVVIVGARDTYETIVTADLERLAGVHFRPGGMRAFLPVPASELGAEDLPLELFWRQSAEDLRSGLLAARSGREALLLLESQLRLRFQPTEEADLVNRAIGCLQRQQGTRPIAGLLHHTGLSEKRVARLFREHVGLSPKRFSRVRRFRRAVAALSASREFRWTDLALDCGYFDQAHFIHEFRGFSGLSPTEFLDRRHGWDAHIAADDITA